MNMDPERLSRIERAISEQTKRLDELSIRFAVNEERGKQVEDKLTDINKRLQSLFDNNLWLFRLVVGAVLAYLLKWMLDGGMHNVM